MSKFQIIFILIKKFTKKKKKIKYIHKIDQIIKTISWIV
jgi:hypothetical protein